MKLSLLKSKKGSTEQEFWPSGTIIWWIIFGIALGFLVVFLATTVSKFGLEQAKIKENVETFLLMQRFLKSPNCFVYDKGEIFSTAIDVDKFSEERLRNCYIADGNFPAFKITLSSDKAKIEKTVKTKNWNDNRDFEEKKSLKDFLVYSQDKQHNGEIVIEIQNLR